MKSSWREFCIVFVVLLLASCAKKPIRANHAPLAACSAEKTSIYVGSGDLINVNAQATDPDGDALSYSWNATGGGIEGSGAQVRWNSGGLAMGSYTVTAKVEDGKGGTANCSAEIRVEPRPNRAPSVTCSVDRSSVIVGERVHITAQASDPDGDTLTYSWRTSGGQIIGAGASVQLDTSGVAPGRYTVTGRVDDGRGGAADCTTDLNVNTPPAPPEASKLNEFFFRGSSARVDNVGKRILDDVVLRLKSEPDAKVVLVGYADPREPRRDRLASQRAEQAKKYMVGQGITEGWIETRTASGQVGAGKQNQRVEIIWVPKGATY